MTNTDINELFLGDLFTMFRVLIALRKVLLHQRNCFRNERCVEHRLRLEMNKSVPSYTISDLATRLWHDRRHAGLHARAQASCRGHGREQLRCHAGARASWPSALVLP